MKGHLHPLTQFMGLSLQYFTDRGFQIIEGPEIETEWFNFDALNMLESHPARDSQDTFWLIPTCPEDSRRGKVEGLDNKKVLRTQTTSSEPRFVTENKLKPPFKLITPGRIFRNEATDATHGHTFYQIDGMWIDKDVNMSHLIGILDDYMKTIFGENLETRVRPSMFPFVEPGMELDVKLPNGKWREMLGAGMAHPTVMKNMGLNPDEWQGVMWGMGMDRYMMNYFKINDIRLSYSGDMRFLKQF